MCRESRPGAGAVTVYATCRRVKKIIAPPLINTSLTAGVFDD